MAMTAAMASIQLHTPAQLQKTALPRTSAAARACLSARTSLTCSGVNGVALRSKGIAGRSVPSRRLSINAVATEVDISKVVPQADRVLLRLEKLAEQSAGGVLLPKSAVKFERYLVGEVIAAGTEVANVEKGQKVMFSDMNAYEVNLGTADKLCFCRAGDLLAIVE